MRETTPFPMDFASLQKGQTLSETELATILNVLPSDGPSWAFALLGLQQMIQQRAGLLAKIEGSMIRILTDLEADEWTARNIALGVRRLVKNAERRQLIDRSEFSPADKAAADVRDRIAVATAQAALKAHRETTALEHARRATREIAATK